MSDNNNPYSAPSSNLEQEPGFESDATLLSAPRSLSPGRSWGWITKGFQFFKRSPLNWILGMIVGFICVLILNIIPIVGQIIYMCTIYVLVGGVMLGCHAQSKGESFEVMHVFAGFKKPMKLIVLSLAMFVLTMLVIVISLGPTYFQVFTSNDPAAMAESMGDPNAFAIKFLFSMLLFIPLSMAVWFAPPLIIINDMSVVGALKMSFMGCWKNILAVVLFAIIGFVFYILAAIPLLLGLFVFFPTFTAATYVAYREIFTETPAL